MKKDLGIYKNTALLSLLSVLERALGFFYRIVLARLLGAEGLGVYQIAVSHFFVLRTLGGGGIPVTLSRTVAKEGVKKNRKSSAAPLSAALLLSLLITLPLTLSETEWAKTSLEYASLGLSDTYEQMIKSGWNIKSTSKTLINYYETGVWKDE